MQSYRPSRPAFGIYDVLFGDEVVASLVKSETSGRFVTWTLDLLVYGARCKMPEPFTAPEHLFSTFQEAQRWLGGARVCRHAGEG